MKFEFIKSEEEFGEKIQWNGVDNVFLLILWKDPVAARHGLSVELYPTGNPGRMHNPTVAFKVEDLFIGGFVLHDILRHLEDCPDLLLAPRAAYNFLFRIALAYVPTLRKGDNRVFIGYQELKERSTKPQLLWNLFTATEPSQPAG